MTLLTRILSIALIALVFAKDIGAFCIAAAHPVDLSSRFQTGTLEALDLTPASQSLDKTVREGAKLAKFADVFTLKNFGEHMARAAISSGVNAVVHGRGVDVGQTLGSGLASFLGEAGARKIGELRGQHLCLDAAKRLGFETDGGVVGPLNFFEHKLVHGALGAVTGALMNVKDPAQGALSGAFGGVVAETIAEALTLFKTEETLVHYQDHCRANNIQPTREGCDAYVQAGMAQFVSLVGQNADRNANIADVSADLGAMIFNLDVNIAHEVARNAVDNNFLPMLASLAVTWGLRLWTAYEVEKAYENDGFKGILTYFEENLTVKAVAGRSKRVMKLGEKTLKDGPALVKALCEKNPLSAGFIKSIEGKIVRYADRLLGNHGPRLATAGGPSVGRHPGQTLLREGNGGGKAGKTREANKSISKNFKKGDNISLDRFSKKLKNGSLEDPKSKQRLVPDCARASGVGPHGGSYWKLLDRRGKRIGTISQDGRWLRE